MPPREGRRAELRMFSEFCRKYTVKNSSKFIQQKYSLIFSVLCSKNRVGKNASTKSDIPSFVFVLGTEDSGALIIMPFNHSKRQCSCSCCASSRSIRRSDNQMYRVQMPCLQASLPSAQAKYLLSEPVKP